MLKTCEYCHLHLALACIDCNLHKGTNLTGFDPETNVITELFHPRRHAWEDYFHWQGLYLVGKTAQSAGADLFNLIFALHVIAKRRFRSSLS